jgi:hypothetical protein
VPFICGAKVKKKKFPETFPGIFLVFYF